MPAGALELLSCTFSAPGLFLMTGPLRPSLGEAATTSCSAKISATGSPPRAAETRFRDSPRLDFRLTPADFFLGVGVFGVVSLAGEEPSLGEGNMGAGEVSRGLRPAEARMADSKAFTLGEEGG